jgi:hypothetical protein
MPLKGLSWVYDEIYLNCHNDSEVWYTQISWEDNPFLSPAEIKQIQSSLSVEELESRKYGRFLASNGLVYKEFDDRYEIRIAAGVPYSYYVNYNWGNRDDKSKQSYNERGLHKEKENYQWVERCIQATSETAVGKGSVNSDL